MPRWLRLFTFKELETHYKDQAEAIKSSSNPGSTNLINPDGTVNKSNLPPSRVAKYK